MKTGMALQMQLPKAAYTISLIISNCKYLKENFSLFTMKKVCFFKSAVKTAAKESYVKQIALCKTRRGQKI